MTATKRLQPKDIALTICFAALYAVFSLIAISPIIGLPGKTVTLAAVMAPLIGILLGPYLGSLSTLLGGTVGFFSGYFSLPSFFSGIVAGLCGGLLRTGRQAVSGLIYFSLLFVFGFYPFVGPVWLFPQLMWFQIAVFLILVSPLQSMAIRSLNSGKAKLFSAQFVICLTSTMAGQIAGSLTYEAISWPIFLADVNAWRLNWQIITFLYPIERTFIALASATIGVLLFIALKTANLAPTSNRASHVKKSP